MIKNKLKIYYKILIQLFFKYLYGDIFLPKNVKNFIKKEKIENKIFKSFKNKNYNIYKIKDARIFTDNNENVAIIKNNFILPFVSFQQVNGELKKINFNSTLSIGTPSFLKRVKGKVFNLCQGDSGNNYFHFIFDIIPKIYLLKTKKEFHSINYFYLNNPKEWQIKILKKLGIKKYKILNSKIHNHIFADEVYAVDHPWYENGYVQFSLNKLPEWIINYNRKTFLNLSKKTSTKKIFLDRSKSNYNHCQIVDLKRILKIIIKKKNKNF